MLLDHINPALNVQLLFGLLLGLIFGVAAQITRFCLRRAVAGDAGIDRGALAVWLFALAVAVTAVQWASATGLAALDGHRFLARDVPVAGILLGALMFGAGMVLTRGCASRLTVLAASGNLRALTVLVVFGLTAHAMMKGALAPLRTALSEPSLALPVGTLTALPGAVVIIPLILLAAVVWLARKSETGFTHMMLAAVIGLVVAAGWVGTSTLLMDDFDPTPVQSLAMTQPWGETFFWIVAATAIPAGFGPGLVAGILLGAFLSAFARGELQLASFETPQQTLRYGAGAVLMGAGGVLAGGCTLGAGLSGVATLGMAAILGLAGIVIGAMATRQMLIGRAGFKTTARV